MYAECSQCNLIWTQMSSPVQIKTCNKFRWSKCPLLATVCHSINWSSEWTRAIYTNSMTNQSTARNLKNIFTWVFLFDCSNLICKFAIHIYLYVYIFLSANRIVHRQNNWREIQMYPIVEIVVHTNWFNGLAFAWWEEKRVRVDERPSCILNALDNKYKSINV